MLVSQLDELREKVAALSAERDRLSAQVRTLTDGTEHARYDCCEHCAIRVHVQTRDGKTGPGPRAETGRAGLGPENPGPRAETGLMIFYLRFLCALCAGRWVITRELCIVVTCKCVVY